MDKPTVFLSHSSAEHIVLSRLREALHGATGGTIDFFLSSIALGKNWMKEIEAALKRAKLMLCFVSPRSLDSPWLFFESGYAYRHGIRIVPVTMQGVDVSKRTPPLGLFQGISLSGHAELNQIVFLLNECFNHDHPRRFTQADFDAIFRDRAGLPDIPSGAYRVYRRQGDREVAREVLSVTIADNRAEVRSPEWESIGIIADGRLVTRFKYFRGSSPDDMGLHDLTWNGTEFTGSCRFDNGKWGSSDLIWRPLRT
jgi:hypothetical protein